MAIARAILEIFTDNSGLDSGLAKGEKSILSFGGVATKIGGVLAGAFAVTEIVSAATEVVNFAGELTDLSAKTGLGTTALQQLKYAGGQVGVELETITGGINQMQKRLAGGDASAVGALKALGVGFDDIRAMAPEDQFKLLAAKVADVEDPAARVKLAMDLFGKSGAEMLPLLTDEFLGLTEKANTLGIVMDEETVASMDLLGDTVSDLMSVGSALIGKVLTPFIPLLTAMAQGAMYLADILGDGLMWAIDKIGEGLKWLSLQAISGLRSLLSMGQGITEMFPSLAGAMGLTDSLTAAMGYLDSAEKALTTTREEGTKVTKESSEAAESRRRQVLAQQQAAEKAAKAEASLNAELQKMADLMTGKALAAEVTKYAKALELAEKQGGLTAYQQDQLTKKAVEFWKQGALLTPQLHSMWLKHEVLNPSIKVTTDAYAGLALSIGKVSSKPLVLPPLPPNPWGPVSSDPFSIIATVNEGLAWAGKPTNIQLRAAPIGASIGRSIKESMAKSLEDIGSVIIGAIQGGGNIGKSIGASMFGSLGDDLGGAIARRMSGTMVDEFGKTVPKQLTGFSKIIGGLAGPLATLAGSALGGAIDKLFGSKGRDAVKEFAESMGGFDALRQKLLVLPDGGEALWKTLTQGVGKNNPAQAAAAIKAIEDALAKAEQQGVAAAAATQQMKDDIASMGVQLKDLQATSEPTFADMVAAANEFGVSIDGAGLAFQQMSQDEAAKKIIDAFDTMKRGGMDVGNTINGMSDELSAFVQDSIKFKTVIPENMRWMIEAAMESGQLIDENGDKLTDMSAINFGEPIKSKWELIGDEISKLTKAIKEMVDQLRGPVVAAVGDAVTAFHGLPTEWNFDVKPNFGMGGGAGVKGGDFGGAMASGGVGRVHRPTWFLAGEKPGGEDFAFSGVGQRFSSGRSTSQSGAVSRTPVVLQVDGREMARTVIQHEADARREVGW